MVSNHPEARRRSGSRFQSPAMIHGPLRIFTATATRRRMSRLASLSPSECLRYTERQCTPPRMQPPTQAHATRQPSAFGTRSSTGTRPIVRLETTATPPEPDSAAVRCAGVMCAFQPAAPHRRKPCTAEVTAASRTNLVSCTSTTCAADWARTLSLAVANVDPLVESNAHQLEGQGRPSSNKRSNGTPSTPSPAQAAFCEPQAAPPSASPGPR